MRLSLLVLLVPLFAQAAVSKDVQKYLNSAATMIHRGTGSDRASARTCSRNVRELAKNSGARLIEVGSDHRLADPEPLAAMVRACG